MAIVASIRPKESAVKAVITPKKPDEKREVQNENVVPKKEKDPNEKVIRELGITPIVCNEKFVSFYIHKQTVNHENFLPNNGDVFISDGITIKCRPLKRFGFDEKTKTLSLPPYGQNITAYFTCATSTFDNIKKAVESYNMAFKETK